MVDGLELEPAVDEVEPLGALNVHSCAEHALRERLVNTQVSGAHGEMAQRNLHVHRRRHHVADQQERPTARGCRYRLVHDAVAEPEPEEDITCELEPAVPPCSSLPWAKAEDQVYPALDVEIEAAKKEDRVVKIMLDLDSMLCENIEGHNAVVIGAIERVKKAVRDGKERHMLDVRIMLRRIGDDVVHVVTALPPA